MNIQTLEEKDFEWVVWTPKKMERICQEALEKRKEIFAEVKSIAIDKKTFANTVFALEDADRSMRRLQGKLEILSQMHPKSSTREAAQKWDLWLTNQLVETDFDIEISEAVSAYKKKGAKSERLDTADKVLLSEFIQSYKDKGFFLPEAEQKELKTINKKIAKLSSSFSININNYHDHILLNKSETQGLSDMFLSSLKKVGGKYKVSLDYPEMIPFMDTSENEKKRKELWQKASKKGGKKNLTLLKNILELKKKKSTLLGFENYSDYIVEHRMAKKGKNIKNFFEPLIERLEKAGREDIRMLEQYKKKVTGKTKEKFYPYDIPYYWNKLQQEKFSVDDQKVKEYFQLENVKKAMFETFGKLFGFKVMKNTSIKLWHKDVEMYDIYQNGKKTAHFALDLFPRKGKFGHAAMWDLATFSKKEFDLKDKRYNPAAAVIACNFSAPTKKVPSLISHYEIQTLFHEFGHALHHILSRVKYTNNSGTNVAWDFVETPSQLLENWAWDEKFLYTMSKHWKTGKKISKREIQNMIAAKNFMSSYANMRQLMMTKFDYDVHNKKIKNPEEYWKKLYKKHIGVDVYEKSLFPAGFGHIVGGYDSGYYSYLWALVYSDDIFSQFQREGIFKSKVGTRYRKEVLEKGSERDEKKSVEAFLGRKSNSKAFIKKLTAQ